MIRLFQPKDIQSVMAIWLSANSQAHDFIVSNYWKQMEAEVAKSIAQAEVYVYTDDRDTILGFIGLMDTYIAGLFIQSQFHSQGIGKALMDYIKRRKPVLTVAVYSKNFQALAFYQREGFVKTANQLDPATQEEEWVMTWGEKDEETKN